MNYQKDIFGTLNKEPEIPGFNYSDLKKSIVSEEYLPIKVEILRITPAIAQNLLTRNNPSNRHLNSSRIQKYAKMIKQSEWQLAEPIIFDSNGVLIDGQHRLKAVIKSGLATDFIVLFGMSPDCATCIDTGANRNLANGLNVLGHTDIDKKHVAIFNATFNALSSPASITQKLTQAEKRRGVLSLKQSFDMALRIKGNSYCTVQAVIARAFFSKRVADKTVLIDFMAYFNGKNIVDDPKCFTKILTPLSPSAPDTLRKAFDDKNKTAFTHSVDTTKGGEALSVLKYQYAQYALDCFIKRRTIKNIKNLVPEPRNLFPVRFLDELLFKDWETIPDDIEKYC